MEVKLVVVGGKYAGQEIPVAASGFVIGRAEGCHLRPQSDRISRQHCEITIKQGYVGVRDLGSKNGTFVNDKQLQPQQEQQLKTEDQLRVGPLEFVVQLAVGVGGKKKPKVRSIGEAAARTVASAAEDDLDISDWLEDDEPSKSEVVYVHPQAGVLRFKSDEDTISTTRDMADLKAKLTKEKDKDKVVGQFSDGKQKKPMAESSRSAAREMLSKLIRGKLDQ